MNSIVVVVSVSVVARLVAIIITFIAVAGSALILAVLGVFKMTVAVFHFDVWCSRERDVGRGRRGW
jgi:hypothetical protein